MMTQDNDQSPPQDQPTEAGTTPEEVQPAEAAAAAEVQPPSPQADALARIAELEGQMATLKGDYLRALAEAQNAQARADRRIESNSKYAIANFAKDLVPVADNLQRALQHVSAEARQRDEELNGLATGVEMTERALQGVLERNGLTRVQSLNQPFDPNVHQAMQEMEDPSVPTGTVLQVFQEGYVLHDRLVRPAMVVVSRGGPKRQAPAPSEPPPSPAPAEWAPGEEPPGKHVDTSA